MRVRLLLNIGTADAKRLELKETLAGKTVDVTDEAGAEMLKHGWATDKLDDKAATLAEGARPIGSADLHDEPKGVVNQSSAIPAAVTEKRKPGQ